MSSFDKTVKLACKPKAAPPKAKYIDPIIAATYSEDGAVHDVCRALATRLREPNTIVVFKALIVLHTMIRNGATDNVLGYLATDDVLRLKSVSNGHWDGYDTPKNLQNYALYLDTRIRTYKDLKHDPVRVQSESNRDARVESSLERSGTIRPSNGPHRSKTIMGRKLRSMTVEKGLLRETKAVQRTINALVECRFYFDNLEDELNITALRMLVKDLLILFQAVNEGVINVLEHYFEMSRVDAETALNIYRSFCKQTERVVEYLGAARKLQNLLNVPVPHLEHAPVSLVAALEEYLSDPNFEQNRIEYKTQKTLAEKNAREGNRVPNGTDRPKPRPNTTAAAPSNAESSSSTSKPVDENKALVDFFASIEGEQTSMFGSSPSNQSIQQQQQQQMMAMQQHAAHNPFAMRQSMMLTGAFPQQQHMPFGQPQPTGFVAPQQTGFVAPQQTGFPGSSPAFQQPQPTGFSQTQQPQQHPSFSSFLRPQPTGFLQAQATGANPFRHSMLMPQSTGMPNFGVGGGNSAFQASGTPFSVPQPTVQPQSIQGPLFGPTPMQNTTSSPPVPSTNATRIQQQQQVPPRPASTPLTSSNSKTFDTPKPLVSHVTGSRNPFGIPQEPAPPLPKAPTLQELATGLFNNNRIGQQALQSPAGQQGQGQGQGQGATSSSSTNGAGAGMSDVASSFSFNKNWSLGSSKPGSDTTGTTGGTPSLLSTQFTSNTAFSSQPTGTTGATSPSSLSPTSPPLRPQSTGFGGFKPFKPTSSFGASLLESLPPIPEPASEGTSAQPTGSGLGNTNAGGSGFASNSNNQSTSPTTNGALPSFGAFGSSTASNSNSNTTNSNGPSFGGGLSATATGLGALNAQPTGLGIGNFSSGNTSTGPGSTFGSSLGVGLRPQTTGSGVANPFRASMFNPSTAPPLPSSSQFGQFGQFGGGGVGNSNLSGLNPNPTGAIPSFGSNLFHHQNAASSGGPTSQQQQQQQQTGVASLI